MQKIDVPNLCSTVEKLSRIGKINITTKNYMYLSIDDEYIHQVFPLLQAQFPLIAKPEYFGIDGMGAHISVIYPEEGVAINNEEFGQEYEFKVTGAFMMQIGNKQYYALSVECVDLINLRKRYGLREKLLFKHDEVSLHITVGVYVC